MLLTRAFTPEQYAEATESWGWLDLSGKTPIFTSPFGDVFYRAHDGFWWLDILEGALTRPWRSADELNSTLASEDGQDMYLMGALAMAAERSGLQPGPEQVYDFRISPVLGGPIELGNIGVIDFVVGVNIAGQLHQQVRALPPGTAISRVAISDDGRLQLST